MLKNLLRVTGVLVLAFFAYDGYQSYRAGLFSLPDMPEGAFPLSFKSGFRGILLGIEDEHETRKYIALPHEIPEWFKEAWSTCVPPSAAERAQLANMVEGARLDAVCTIEADGKIYPRGAIFSAPKL